MIEFYANGSVHPNVNLVRCFLVAFSLSVYVWWQYRFNDYSFFFHRQIKTWIDHWRWLTACWSEKKTQDEKIAVCVAIGVDTHVMLNLLGRCDDSFASNPFIVCSHEVLYCRLNVCGHFCRIESKIRWPNANPKSTQLITEFI